MPDLSAQAASTGATLHFLTFRLDDRLYALPAGDVAEVIRIPAVARMPQSPTTLLGLANLRGAILPVASGRGLLGQRGGEDALHGRAIVMNGAAPVALTVDAVTELVELTRADVETRETELAALPGEVLTGAFQPSKGGPVIKVLDIKALLSATFVARERSPRRHGQNATVAETREAQAVRAKLMAFAVAGQDYALPLDIVQEIVAAPALLANIPHSEALVLGVTSLRDRLLPLLSLRALLGFGPNPKPQKEKVVVATVQGNLVGLVADEMRYIFSADESRMDPIPDVLAARTGGESRIAAIYRGADGGGLVSILSPQQIFGDDVMQRLAGTRKAVEMPEETAKVDGETRQYLVFRLGDEEYGLPIGAVEEVAQVPEKIARVPNTPKFLEGVINLRGEVIPVVDQRKRFQMPALDHQASRRLVVVRTDRHTAGLIVDGVSEVLRVGVDDVDVAPDLTGEGTKLVMGVANLESQKRIILLLDPAELLTRAERGLLDKFAKQQDGQERSGK
jgi:purine-binding chemotaxis protein CheW